MGACHGFLSGASKALSSQRATTPSPDTPQPDQPVSFFKMQKMQAMVQHAGGRWDSLVQDVVSACRMQFEADVNEMQSFLSEAQAPVGKIFARHVARCCQLRCPRCNSHLARLGLVR